MHPTEIATFRCMQGAYYPTPDAPTPHPRHPAYVADNGEERPRATRNLGCSIHVQVFRGQLF